MKQSKDVLKLTLDCKNKSSTVRVAPQVYSNNNNHNNNNSSSSTTCGNESRNKEIEEHQVVQFRKF